jgi:hypothetical protein
MKNIIVLLTFVLFSVLANAQNIEYSNSYLTLTYDSAAITLVEDDKTTSFVDLSVEGKLNVMVLTKEKSPAKVDLNKDTKTFMKGFEEGFKNSMPIKDFKYEVLDKSNAIITASTVIEESPVLLKIRLNFSGEDMRMAMQMASPLEKDDKESQLANVFKSIKFK